MPDQGETPFPGDWFMSFKVAVVGATGNVGREMLNVLAERGIPAGDVTAVASERSAGGEVSYGEDHVLQIEDLDPKPVGFKSLSHGKGHTSAAATKGRCRTGVESRKILDSAIAVHATCVRVPVFIGHAEAINVEFERPISVEQARAALKKAPS